MRPRRINYELINKLAGYGPYCSERPTRANMERLADPAVPLSERIRLLQAIAGGPLHYEEAADCLDEDPERVMRCKALVLQERLTDNVTATFQFDFAAPRTQREAIAACYGDHAIDARDTGIRAGRKALREAGIQGRAGRTVGRTRPAQQLHRMGHPGRKDPALARSQRRRMDVTPTRHPAAGQRQGSAGDRL